MVKLLTAAGIIAATLSSATYYNKDTEMVKDNAATAPVPGKWVKLFDGKTTKGWHTYGKKSAGSAWQAKGGALVLDPGSADESQRGDLVTDKEYKNFDLKLEWKISEGGNSGIIFYVADDKAKYHETYNTGLEMQVLDNERHPDSKIIKHRAGDLYDLISCSKETVKPAGEWNKAEVMANNGKLDLFLNGTKVVSTTLWNQQWKDMVAKSKFGSMPDFGTYKKGHIALQDHGNMVSYRNIQIREL